MDGEGNFRFNKFLPGRANRTARPSGSFRMQAAQVDRVVLDRLQAAVGAGKVYGPYLPKQKNRKPHFAYAAAGPAGIEAFQKIRPYLGPIKRAQGDKAISDFIEMYKNREKLGNGIKRKRELGHIFKIDSKRDNAKIQ